MAATITRTACPLSASELAQLRAMLREQQGFRLEQLAQLTRPGRPGPLGSSVDEVTRTLLEGARVALADVSAALERMTAGRYGRCVRCADALPLERLEILPQVALCMPCQRAYAGAGGSGTGPDAAGGGVRTA